MIKLTKYLASCLHLLKSVILDLQVKLIILKKIVLLASNRLLIIAFRKQKNLR